MAQNLPYRIRLFQPSDERVVFATWLNSFEPFRDRRVPRDAYYASYHNRVSDLLVRAVKDGSLLVACSEEDPETVFGWVCGTAGCVDYVFVKALYRRLGIGRALLQALAAAGPLKAFTHHTDAVPFLRLSGCLGREVVYNPYLMHT